LQHVRVNFLSAKKIAENINLDNKHIISLLKKYLLEEKKL